MTDRYEPGLVSVIVPTYNRADLLADSLESVLAQAYRPIELIVVDDGSTDDTKDLLEEWSKKCANDDQFELRYFYQENKGAPAARNLGLIESGGEYVQFLDSDDVLHSDKLTRQVDALRRDGGVDFVWSETARFRGSPAFDGPIVTGRRTREPWPGCLRETPWHTCGGLYRRQACVRTGPWNEGLRRCQDWDYCCRFLQMSPLCLYVRGVLSAARVHPDGQIRDLHRTRVGVKADIEAAQSVETALASAGPAAPVASDVLAGRYLKIARRAARLGWADLSTEARLGAEACASMAFRRFELSLFRGLCRGAGFKAAGWTLGLALDSAGHLRLFVARVAARCRTWPVKAPAERQGKENHESRRP